VAFELRFEVLLCFAFFGYFEFNQKAFLCLASMYDGTEKAFLDVDACGDGGD